MRGAGMIYRLAIVNLLMLGTILNLMALYAH